MILINLLLAYSVLVSADEPDVDPKMLFAGPVILDDRLHVVHEVQDRMRRIIARSVDPTVATYRENNRDFYWVLTRMAFFPDLGAVLREPANHFARSEVDEPLVPSRVAMQLRAASSMLWRFAEVRSPSLGGEGWRAGEVGEKLRGLRESAAAEFAGAVGSEILTMDASAQLRDLVRRAQDIALRLGDEPNARHAIRRVRETVASKPLDALGVRHVLIMILGHVDDAVYALDHASCQKGVGL